MATYIASIFPTIEGNYAVEFFDFPEANTQGSTIEEAIEMAEDVLKISIEEYTRERRTIPSPSSFERIKELTLADIEETKEFLDMSKEVFYQHIKAPSVEIKPVKVTVSFPKNVLEQIDKKAAALGMTRSGLLANSALAYEG